MLLIAVSPEPGEVELAADRLWGLGVVAVEERCVGDDIELWTSLGADEMAATQALSSFPFAWRFEGVDDGVGEEWRAFARPIHFAGGMVVRPAWLASPPDDNPLHLAIEPGGTFGLGDHPTTVMCVGAVRDLVRPGDRVLDVGTGSGILAVLAAKLGASACLAIDLGPDSVTTTGDNSRRNGVEDRVTATSQPLRDVSGAFDLIVANILAPVLLEMADDFKRLLAPGGRLVLSGMLTSRCDHVVKKMAPLRVTCRRRLDGWIAIEMSRDRS